MTPGHGRSKKYLTQAEIVKLRRAMYQHRQRTNPLVPHPSTDAPHPRQTTEYVEPELHGSYEHTSSLGEASRDLSWPVELIRQPPISTSVPVVVQDAIKNYKPPPGFQLVIPKAGERSISDRSRAAASP
ncbi:hypothetical protein F441_21199 [Phytophthora nicotianae CJ01A1]|uniref:Uncharacterized protein n=1 Tax=Phytophthora nicotianae CJ01A1 TaxID=1317063 RepID=W2VTP5_PHYNI|nr:hypothetical protein F441_21199 [Phytophthora nicotianae CJ01A1]